MDVMSEARLGIVRKWATKYQLDPALVCAVCEQESSWNIYAIRWEAAFYLHYVVPLKLQDMTEATCRAMSFGLMQVMGQVARENGFRGRYLSELCSAEQGLDVGCAVLQRKIALGNGDISAGLQHYNGGGNSEYAAQVIARMASYQ